MSWQILVLGQAFLIALATIITRILARDKKTAKASLAITASWFMVLFIVGLIMLPLFGQVHLSSLHLFWWRFVFGGLAFALTNVFTYYTLVYLDAAVATIFGTLSALFTVVGAAIVLREDLSSLQIFGAIGLLFSIIYTALATRHKPNKLVHKKLVAGFLYAVLAAIFFAIASVNEKSLLGHVSVGDYLVFGWFGEMAMAVVLAVIIQPKAFKVLANRSVLGWTVSLGVIRAVSGLFFILSVIRSNNVALITVISSFRLIIVAVLGVWLLKERQKIYQKIVGSAIAIAALTLMFWQN